MTVRKATINMANPGFAPGQFHTINLFQSSATGVQHFLPDDCDMSKIGDDGVPIAAPGGSYGVDVRPPAGYMEGGGNFVIKWSGEGQYGFSLFPRVDGNPHGSLTILDGSGFVSGSGDSYGIEGTDVRVVFQVSGHPDNVDVFRGGFHGSTYSGMGVPVFCREDQETALDDGGVFNPLWIDKLKYYKFGRHRYMQWTSIADGCGVSDPTLSDINNINYNGWGTKYPSAFRAASNGAVTYVPSPDGGVTPEQFIVGDTPTNSGALTDGEMILCNFATQETAGNGLKFANNTGNATFKRGTADAKPLFTLGGFLGATRDVSLYSGIQCVIYNARMGCYVGQNSTAVGGGNPCSGINAGVPLAAQALQCNLCDVDGHFCLPSNITPTGAYNVGFYLGNNLNRHAYVECQNENWNTAFFQYSVINTIKNNLGLADHTSTIGYMNRIMFEQVIEGWLASGRNRNELHCSFGVWTVGGYWAIDPVWKNALLGTDLPDYDTKPDRPCDFIDNILIAPYIVSPNIPVFAGGYVSGSAQQGLYDAADQHHGGDTDGAYDWMANELRSGTGGNGDVETLDMFFNRISGTGIYASWQSVIDQLGTDRTVSIEQYEGGPHFGAGDGARYPSVAMIDGLGKDGNTYGGATGRIGVMFEGFKHSTQFKNLVLEWAHLGNDDRLPNSGSPCWYTYIDGFTVWTLAEGDDESAFYSSADALKQFNETHRIRLTAS